MSGTNDSHVSIPFVIVDVQPVNPESSIAEEVRCPPQHILVQIAGIVIDNQLGRCSQTRPISCSMQCRVKESDTFEMQ